MSCALHILEEGGDGVGVMGVQRSAPAQRRRRSGQYRVYYFQVPRQKVDVCNVLQVYVFNYFCSILMLLRAINWQTCLRECIL